MTGTVGGTPHLPPGTWGPSHGSDTWATCAQRLSQQQPGSAADVAAMATIRPDGHGDPVMIWSRCTT